MKARNIGIILIAVLIGAFLSGCVDSPKNEVKTTPAATVNTASGTPGATAVPTVVSTKEPEGTIRVSGAFALYPMMIKWGEEYEKLHPKVKFDISAGGAGKGMTDALGGLVDIGMVSRKITTSEEEKGAYWEAVTKDAVVATVNKNNPVLAMLKTNGLKREVFEKIYINGSITTWGQATGTAATDKINVYTRSDACGAGEAWALYLGKYKQEKLKGLGADVLINHTKKDFGKEVWELTNKRGVDVVIDSIGEATWQKSLRCLARNGRLVTYGATTGPTPPTDLRLVFWRQLKIIGTTMGNRKEVADVMKLIWARKLKPVVDRVFPLQEAARAQQMMENREQFGKLILIP